MSAFVTTSVFHREYIGSQNISTGKHLTSRSIRAQVSEKPTSKPKQSSTQQNAQLNDKAPQRLTKATPRPLWRVVSFSLLSGLAYYGYYKYCIEEELRELTGKGIGGLLVVSPFVIGVTGPLWVRALNLDNQIGIGTAVAGLAWIAYWQWEFYRKVNTFYEDIGMTRPLCTHWLIVPVFNIIVGLRAIHFYSDFLQIRRGDKADADPLATALPFLSKPSLGIVELVTTPSLWLNFSGAPRV